MKRVYCLLLAGIMCMSLLAGCGSQSAASSVSSGSAAFASQETSTSYPERSINNIVSSTAGGGTDLGNRTLSAAMEDSLGTTIAVSNMEGGSGGVAAAYVQGKTHDGYTLLGMSEGILPLAVLNCAPYTTDDWEYFIMGGTPCVMSVAADSKYQSAKEVIDDMLANPGTVKLANSVVGCVWDIKAALLKEATGVDYQFMSYQGSNPSILACLNGEVDVIITGLGEQAEYLEAGKLRPLAMLEEDAKDIGTFGTVPSIVDTVPQLKGTIGTVSQMVGFAVPSDVDQAVLDKLTEAFLAAMDSQELSDYCETKSMTKYGYYGEEAKTLAKSMESTFSWILYDNGVATVDPSTYNIDRP